jgi:hypothetical protein
MTQTKECLFVTWRTVALGNLESSQDLIRDLRARGCRINNLAGDILQSIAVAPSETAIELVNVSVADLGFKEGATRKQVYTTAKNFGLSLVPAEVGPQLRLQYMEQQPNEWLAIGTDPIADLASDFALLHLTRYRDSQWLCGEHDRANEIWQPEKRWVFSHF